MRGGNFTEYTSGFVVPMDPLVFQDNDAIAIGMGPVGNHRISHIILESGGVDD